MGSRREGSFDGWALLQGFRRRAQHNGVVYLRDRVVDIVQRDGRVIAVVLESGRRVNCGHVVNAAGTRASLVAKMAGLRLPVEPRSRTTFVFDCRTPIDGNVPLTVTPEGVHFRREQQQYVTGTVPLDDRAVDHDDLEARGSEFEELIWPVLANYVPQFDHVKVVASWGGHYAFNTLDHNLVIGACAVGHPAIDPSRSSPTCPSLAPPPSSPAMAARPRGRCWRWGGSRAPRWAAAPST